MNPCTLPLDQLCDVAIDAACRAGRAIQAVDRSKLQGQFKKAGSSAASQIVTEVDRHSEDIIRDVLRESCHTWSIAFVGEESYQEPSGEIPERLQKPYHWSVDPLDGTLAFLEANTGYAVSIALVDQSGLPLIGVVYDPVSATLVHGIKGQGAFKNRLPLSILSEHQGSGSLPQPLLVFADASFRTAGVYRDIWHTLNAWAADSGLPGVEVIYGSGAVKNACQLLDHPSACYLKLPKAQEGGGSIWDFAATACIVTEAGGWVSDIHAKPLDLNRQASTFMNHNGVVFASNKRIGRYLTERL